jgi:flagellar hook-associated protein 2
LAGIQLSGLASGLDTQSIITQLMSIESQPRTRVAQQQVVVQARQDALRSVDSSLTSLKYAASDLRSALLWIPTQKVTSTDDTVVSAQLTSGAAPGGYTVNVATLASADSRTYGYNAGGGDLTIDYKSDGAAQSKTFDLAGKSVDEAVTAINGANDSPVWAVNINGKLSLSRRETGDHDSWGFEASGTALGAQIASRDGTDATYTIAGDATVYSSHNGTATEGLPGVEMTLRGIGTTTINVTTPQVDSSAVADKIKAFVTAYNASVDLVRGKLNEKPIANPTTDADAAVGSLYGDQSLSSTLSQMRQLISEAGLDKLGVTVPSTGSGTSPDALAGKLSFNQVTFDAAWAKDPAAVQAALGSPTTTGFAQRFEKVLDPIVRSGDGLLDQRVRAADDEIKSIQDSLAQWDVRLQAKQDYLQKQFTALETAMNASQSQMSDLQGQIAGLLGSS